MLGAVPIYILGAKRADDNDWMTVQLGVHPRTVVDEIRFYRLGNGSTSRSSSTTAPTGNRRSRATATSAGIISRCTWMTWMPRQTICGTGVEVMGEPVASAGASAGQRWLYFRSPWGMQFELVSFPGGKAYESGAAPPSCGTPRSPRREVADVVTADGKRRMPSARATATPEPASPTAS